MKPVLVQCSFFSLKHLKGGHANRQSDEYSIQSDEYSIQSGSVFGLVNHFLHFSFLPLVLERAYGHRK